MVWHGEPVDEYGNVECLKCGKKQSPTFTACIYCCSHEVLLFDEDWDCGWKLTVYCKNCGKYFDFNNRILIEGYKAIKAHNKRIHEDAQKDAHL